jgi:hypothetical protein
MKTKLLLVCSAVLAFMATSCNVKETIVIKEDGSGVMSIDMDGDQLMSMAGGEMAGKEKIDSVFAFKDLFKGKEDSIAKLPKADQERIKLLQNVKGHMLMDPEEGKFNMQFNNEFKKASDLGNMMGAFEAMSKMNKKDAPDVGLADKTPGITYFYDGKKFKKTVAPKDAKVPEEANEQLDMIMQMFEGSTYTVTYQFPKKIKTVSNKNAVISADKKTVTVAYDLKEYMETPVTMSLEVDFEK